MNNIALQGYIRDIEFSHDRGNVDYNKASLICPGVNGKEDDLFLLQFKSYSNRYKEGDFISIKGNLRSYSQRQQDGKSSVLIYVFTYFDLPDLPINTVQLDGRICKISPLQQTQHGKYFIHFILANNIFKGNKKINCYIPCTARGELAQHIADYKVNDFVILEGEFHSHTYTQKITNEIKLAHEVIVKNIFLGV